MAAAPSVRDRLKAARGARREHRDVDFVLDQTVQEDVERLEQQIDEHEAEITELEAEKARIEPDLRFSDPRPAEIDGKIAEHRKAADDLEQQRDEMRAGSLLRLRFEKLDGEVWAGITAAHPPRVDSTIDQLSGYNYHASAKAAAPLNGRVVGDDGEPTDETLEAEDWRNLFAVASGREMEWLASSLWELNDFGPRRRIDQARKASAGGSGSKSS